MPDDRHGSSSDPLLEIGRDGEVFDAGPYREFAEACREGSGAALVTVVASEGSVPRGIGAVMTVRPDGSILGTIGGGAIEHACIGYAMEALADGKARRLHFDFTAGEGRNLGMACAGKADIFIQPTCPGPELLLFGAGHIARALAPMAITAGFAVTVLDDRPGYPGPQEFPSSARLRPGSYGESMGTLRLSEERTYVVIVTHGHERDAQVLSECLELPVKYLGMIGSRAKVSRVFAEVGTTDERKALLERVHAPIGLDLGGRAPGEIAVSILSEMLAVRHGRDRIGPMAILLNREQER